MSLCYCPPCVAAWERNTRPVFTGSTALRTLKHATKECVSLFDFFLRLTCRDAVWVPSLRPIFGASVMKRNRDCWEGRKRGQRKTAWKFHDSFKNGDQLNIVQNWPEGTAPALSLVPKPTSEGERVISCFLVEIWPRSRLWEMWSVVSERVPQRSLEVIAETREGWYLLGNPLGSSPQYWFLKLHNTFTKTTAWWLGIIPLTDDHSEVEWSSSVFKISF